MEQPGTPPLFGGTVHACRRVIFPRKGSGPKVGLTFATICQMARLLDFQNGVLAYAQDTCRYGCTDLAWQAPFVHGSGTVEQGLVASRKVVHFPAQRRPCLQGLNSQTSSFTSPFPLPLPSRHFPPPARCKKGLAMNPFLGCQSASRQSTGRHKIAAQDLHSVVLISTEPTIIPAQASDAGDIPSRHQTFHQESRPNSVCI